jgi:hypothetical protein
MNDVRALFIIATLLILVGFAAMWDFGWLHGLGFNGTVAAVLGTMLTTVVGVGLMGLMVYSSQSQHDQKVHDFSRRSKLNRSK